MKFVWDADGEGRYSIIGNWTLKLFYLRLAFENDLAWNSKNVHYYSANAVQKKNVIAIS